MSRIFLETEQKALEINLDDRIYGAFAEIGAGQEVARYFFQVGAAAGTIAKSMSAYDKTVSDEISAADALMTSRNIDIPDDIHSLYHYLQENKNIVDIQHFKREMLDIRHKDVLRMIQEGSPGWGSKVPEAVAALIQEIRAFQARLGCRIKDPSYR